MSRVDMLEELDSVVKMLEELIAMQDGVLPDRAEFDRMNKVAHHLYEIRYRHEHGEALPSEVFWEDEREEITAYISYDTERDELLGECPF